MQIARKCFLFSDIYLAFLLFFFACLLLQPTGIGSINEHANDVTIIASVFLVLPTSPYNMAISVHILTPAIYKSMAV